MTHLIRVGALASLSLLFASSLFVKESEAASVNCSEKRSILDIMVCSDTELTAMDSEESDIYATLRSLASGAQKTTFMGEQQRFLQERFRVCPVPIKPALSDQDTRRIVICLKGVYSLRINHVNKELAHYQNRQPPESTAHVAEATAVASQPIQTGSTALPQCDQSLIAKKYYLASCVSHGMTITGKGVAGDAETKMGEARKQLDCTPDSLDRVRAAAYSAAERIVSSGMISSLMDFNDAINLECNKAADAALK